MKNKKMMRKIAAAAMAGALVLPATVSSSKAQTLDGWVDDSQLNNSEVAAPEAYGPTPDALQYEYQKQELAAFCHFGPNTFNEIEWGENYGNTPPAEIFTLGPNDDFDAETLVETLKNAGFKRLIVTAKHHDGFCIWASEYTKYDVASTNYKNGEGDILAEISKACSDYDMDMGLYLSPWDIHDQSYGYFDKDGNALVGSDGQPLNGMSWEEVEEKDVYDYNEYYRNQLEEILGNDKYGNKGEFVEIWMDGAKGSGYKTQNYNFDDWFATIQKYEGKEAGREADCLLFGSGAKTTVRWIGNELGFAPDTNWAQAKLIYKDGKATDIDTGWDESTGYAAGYPDGDVWTVPECDARITSGWFWGNTKKTPKSMEELSEMYFRSVGHNGTLLLNVPPNDEGKLDKAIQERIVEFGNAVKNTFKTNKAEDKAAYADTVLGNSKAYSASNVLDGDQDTYWTPEAGNSMGSVLIDLGETTNFDVVSIEEAIQLGQRITNYKVEYSNDLQSWETMDEGTTVGSKRLSRTSPVKARYVKVTVSTNEDTSPLISEIGVYKATGGLELNSSVPEGLTVVDNTDKDTSDGFGFTYNNSWVQEKGKDFINGTSMYANEGSELTLNFHGTKAYLMGTLDPNHGKAMISVDNGPEVEIDTKASKRSVGNVLYASDDLEDGDHTLTLRVVSDAIGIEAAAVIDNQGKGMFEFEHNAYRVLEAEDESATLEHKLTVKRVGGTNGEAVVQVENNPGTAMQGNYDANLSGGTLTFAPGETEKQVSLYTKYDSRIQGDTSFTMNLVNATNDVIIGFNKVATITIEDRDVKTKEQLAELIAQGEIFNTQEYLYVSGWDAFQDAFKAAKETLADSDATIIQYGNAYRNLTVAINGLVVRDNYSEEDPFIMPVKKDETKVLEAELATLKNTGENEEYVLAVEERDWASNKKIINCFNAGDQIEVPYNASRAGKYKVVLTYRSGSEENSFDVSEVDGKIKNVSVVAGNDDATVTKTKEFEIEVVEAGAGTLVLTAGTKNGPQLDKLDITASDLNWKEFTIKATAGTGGTITPSGDNVYTELSDVTYTITPDNGYEIEDVKVNGESQGAITSYTFTELSKDSTIEATFKFKYYNESTPFEFPEKIGSENKVTLEAEKTELINTGDANEQWKLGIESGTWASGGQFVNCLNSDDQLVIHYNAPNAGIYQFTATYRSGSDTNKLVWSGDKVISGEVAAGNSDASVVKTVDFLVEITEAGKGKIVFTAPSTNSPQLDKFDIVYFSDKESMARADLKALIEEAKAILENASDYQTATIENLKTVLAKVEEVYENDEASVEQLEQAKADLQTAIDGLLEVVDKTELAQYIAKVQEIVDNIEDYSKYSVYGLEENLAKAKEAYNNENATENEVAAMVRTLKYGVENARKKAFIEDLEKLVAQAKAIDLEGYTPASVDVFELVLSDAQTLLDSDLSFENQDSVDKMYDRLSKAINLLTKISDLEEDPGQTPDKPGDKPGSGDSGDNNNNGSQNPSNGNNDSSNPENGNASKTGDDINMTPFMVLMALSCLGAWGVLKRTKEIDY